MIRSETRQQRLGMTLIELLVVMAIIAVVGAIGYLSFPSFSSRTMVDAADRLQMWLLIAKQQAKRDNRPTGVRIVVNSASTTYASTLQYVQQPADFVGPFPSTCTSPDGTKVLFAFPPGGSLLGNGTLQDANTADDVASVQWGDYILIDLVGTVCPIGPAAGLPPLVSSTQLTLGPPPTPYSAPAGQPSPSVPPVTVPSTFRIIRQPRLLLGEEALLLPGNVSGQTTPDPNSATLIDTSTYNQTTNPKGCLGLPPARTINGVNCYEILFSPTGSVVGPAASSGMICLWVCVQGSPGAPPPPPALVAIRTRTGAVSVANVNPNLSVGSDPYTFARDPRASGM